MKDSKIISRRYMDCIHRICALVVTCCMVVLLVAGLSCHESQADDCTNYADASAADGGDGSLATPWNKLSQVNDAVGTFQPGDHICFKRGGIFGYETSDAHLGMLSISTSGTAQDPIVFEAYGDLGDPLPIIDGSQNLNNSWGQDATNPHIYSRVRQEIFRPALLYYNGIPKPPITTLQFSSVPTTIAKNNILVQKDGVHTTLLVTSSSSVDKTVSGITPYTILEDKNVYVKQLIDGVETTSPSIGKPTVKTSNALEGLTEPGDWYWDDSGFLYLYSELNPNLLYALPVSLERDGIRVESAHDVIIRNLVVERVSQSGIVLAFAGTSNVTVEQCTIYGVGESAFLLWDASNNTIRNNTMDSNGGGVSVYATPQPGAQSVDNIIENNTISNCRGACIGLSRDESTFPGDVSGNLISGNTITNANTMSYDGAGIYTLYAGSNTIQSNVISDCGSLYLRSAGIMIDVSGGAMTITGNTIENNSLGGIALSGAGHLVTGNTLRNNGVSSWKIAQITFFDATTPTTPGLAANCTVTGNTIEADQDHHFFNIDPGNTIGHTINYNTYRGQATAQFSWNTWDDQWMDFETWKTTTGYDANSTLNKVFPLTSAIYMLLLAN